MHSWDDKDFKYRDDLDEAGMYISTRCVQFARLGVWSKEKWGILRITTRYFDSRTPLNSLTYPGHAFYRLPEWVHSIDCIVGKVTDLLRVPIHWYQHQVLKFFWKRAAKKWPHIKDEIMEEYVWRTRYIING